MEEGGPRMEGYIDRDNIFDLSHSSWNTAIWLSFS